MMVLVLLCEYTVTKINITAIIIERHRHLGVTVTAILLSALKAIPQRRSSIEVN